MRRNVQQPARPPADAGRAGGERATRRLAPRAGAPRTAHFPRLRVSSLFVHGVRDPFGSLAELRLALALIPAPTTLVAVAGAAHDLGGGRGAAADHVSRAVVAFLGRPA